MSTGGGDNTFEIKLDIDNTAAQVSAENSIAYLQRVESAAARNAAAIEQIAKLLSDRQITEQQRIEAARAKADEADKARSLASAQRLTEMTRAKREAAEKAKQAEIQAGVEAEAAFMARVDRTIAMHERAARKEAEIRRQAIGEFTHAYAERWGGEVVSSIDFGMQKTKSFREELMGVATVLGPIGMLARGIADAMAKGREESANMAKFATDIRDRLREQAALAGKGAPSDQDVAEFGKFRASTGMAVDAAHAFMVEYGSAVATATEQNMSASEQNKLREQAAIFASRVNKPGDTSAIAATGALAGTLATFQQHGTAEGVIAMMQKINDIAIQGKGSNQQQFDQLSKVLTYFVSPDGKGLAKSPQEAAALVAMMSLTRPVEEAGTGVTQLSRAVRGFQHRLRHGGIGMAQADYLKKIGINENQTVFESLQRLFPDMAKAEAAGRAPDAYLKEMGFHSDEEVIAMVSAFRAAKQGGSGKIFALANSPLDLAGGQAKQQEYLKSISAQRGIADAEIDQARTAQGMKQENYEILRKRAIAELTAEGSLGTPEAELGNWIRSTTHLKMFTGVSGEEEKINEKMIEMLARQGINVESGAMEAMTGGRDNMLTRGYDWLFGDITRNTDIASGQRQKAISEALSGTSTVQAAAQGDWGGEGASAGGDWGEEAISELRQINMTLKSMIRGPISNPAPNGGRPGRAT